jgi:hypothetical protein
VTFPAASIAPAVTAYSVSQHVHVHRASQPSTVAQKEKEEGEVEEKCYDSGLRGGGTEFPPFSGKILSFKN